MGLVHRVGSSRIILGVAALSLAGLVFSFQNCSPGFKIDENSESVLSLKFDEPKIEFTTPDATLFASSDVSLGVLAVVDPRATIKSQMCSLDGVAPVKCPVPLTFKGLADGNHTLSLTITDSRELSATARLAWTVDATKPTITVNQKPGSLSGASVSFDFSSADALSGIAKIECAFDTDTYTACASPLKKDTLAAGAHRLRIRATDKAGNVSDISDLAWTVDLSAPVITISQSPAALTNQTNATFAFSATAPGTTITKFACAIDATTATACTSPKAYSGLTEGPHKFTISATNDLNQLTASREFMWSIDLTPPTPPVITTTTTQPYSNNFNPSFMFTATDLVAGVASYECMIDGAVAVACVSPTTFAARGNMAHEFKVRAIDKVGNTSTYTTFAWTSDTNPPEVLWVEVPGVVTGPSAAFKWTVTDSASGVDKVQCALQPVGGAAATFKDCATGTASYDSLAPGGYSFLIKASDKAGNSLYAPMQYDWTVKPPYVGLPAMKVATGAGFTCVITSNSALQCFGRNDASQLGDGTVIPRANPSTLFASGVTDISASEFYVCAVVSGSVYCWGNQFQGGGIPFDRGAGAQAVPKQIVAAGATAVAAGRNFGCAIVAGGVQCWGVNEAGQLGNGTKTNSFDTPVTAISSGSGVTAIAAGYENACAIANGALRCWGSHQGWNDYSEPLTDRLSPQSVFASGATSVGLDGWSACATVNGEIRCWGTPYQFYTSPTAPKVFLPSANPYANGLPDASYKVDLAYTSQCATNSKGALYCWGYNDAGQLGTGNFYRTDYPQLILSSGVTQVSASRTHTCVIQSGQLRCWGANSWGELGLGKMANQPSPKMVATGVTSVRVQRYDGVYWTDIYDYPYHDFSMTCFATTGDTICGGATNLDVTYVTKDEGFGTSGNHRGRFNVRGDVVFDNAQQMSCQLVAGKLTCNGEEVFKSGVRSFDVGNQVFVCAVMTDGSVKCLGDNQSGELGNGTASYVYPFSTVPSVPISAGATQVSVGWVFGCALVGDAAKCWGDYMPNPDGLPRGTPITVIASGVEKIRTSNYAACAVLKTHKVTCWGGHGWDIGDGSMFDADGVVDVAMTDDTFCAITLSGALKCLGKNANGQVGNGTFAKVTTPATIFPSGATSVSMGAGQTCAVVGGNGFCWGDNLDWEAMTTEMPWQPLP